MKLYTDLFTGTQILSDSYKITLQYEDVIGKVKARNVIKTEGQVDIGGGNYFSQGQEPQQNKNPNVTKVIDIVDGFGYQQTSLDKPSFETYFKAYMKKILLHLQTNKSQRVNSFKTGAQKFFAWIKLNFDDITFYTPSDYDTENSLPMAWYQKEEDDAPTFFFIMDGFKQTKV